MAILISGRGSNMQALIRAGKDENYPARIVGVISSRTGAEGLELARRQNIPVATNRLGDFAEKDEADREMTRILMGWGVQIVCLAGFMRILSRSFVEQWAGRVINIHPSLLPCYKGLDTHQRVLDAGDRVHGCTVHFVINELDAGATIAQSQVPVLPGDDAQALARRVLEQEHLLYPRALAMVATSMDPDRQGD